jgi:hypothetical protein
MRGKETAPGALLAVPYMEHSWGRVVEWWAFLLEWQLVYLAVDLRVQLVP